MNEKQKINAALIDRVCRGEASIQEGALLRGYIRDLHSLVPLGGVAAIAAERRRQVEQLGRTPERDDRYEARELARAGAAYVQHYYERQFLLAGLGVGPAFINVDQYRRDPPPDCWPWSGESWNPKDARHDLERAGALIAAEIDRLDRKANVVPIHFVLLGKATTAKTRCGITLCAIYPEEMEALPSANDERIKYTEVPRTVTCHACIAELRKMGMPSAVKSDPLAAVRWICPKCTTVNGIDNPKCTGCGEPKP